MARVRYVCAECRSVGKVPDCEHELLLVSHRWRAPRKHQDRAWRLIATGEVLWDRRAVERAQRRERSRIDRLKEVRRLRKIASRS